jgi:hypothetical protein
VIDAAIQSMKGFLTGKLFARPAHAYGLLALGVAITAAVLVAGVKLGLPLPASAAIAGLVGGATQPRLYKGLKYR